VDPTLLALGRAAAQNFRGVVSAASHILSFAEYAAIRHETPYVVDVSRGGCRLLLFGSAHSSDPDHPTFDQLEAAFARVAPSFALHEGTPPALEREREVAIRRHGEAGLLRLLASRVGIETASMDIPLAEEAKLLRRQMAQRDALVFLVVRQLASFNRKTARMDFDAYFADFFGRIGPALGLAAIDWPLIEHEHLRVLGRPLEARRITAVETDPMRDDLVTQRIARLSNRLRDEHMLRQLIDAVARHGRVFAAAGVTHAVMLEPALLAAVGRR
jgi:hypothetical protein